MRIISAILLFLTGAIHGFLVVDGVGGTLGVLFVLNGIAGIVLAVGMLAARGRLLAVVGVLALLFLVASLVSLLLALTVGLFGITETWGFTRVPETVVVEALGVVAAAIVLPALLRRGARVPA